MKGLILLTLMASAAGLEATSEQPIEQTSESVPESSIVAESSSVAEASSSEAVSSSSEETKSLEDSVSDILSSIFDAQTVAMIMSWVAYAGTIIGLAVKLKSLHQKNQLTLNDVKDAVLKAVDGKVEESVKKSLGDAMDKVVANESSITNAINVMAQALITDDADTKIALLKLLKDSGADVDDAIKTIEDDKKEEAENKVKAEEKLDEIIESKEEATAEDDSSKGLI